VSPSAYGGNAGLPGKKSDKGLTLPLAETVKRAWEDPDLRQRLTFVLMMFAVYALGIHIPVPVQGFDSEKVKDLLESSNVFQLLNVLGGGALRRLSIFALGLNPYITASIIMQILQQALPEWKKEMQEGGEYARKKNNQRIRFATLFLCFFQGWGFLQYMASIPEIGAIAPLSKASILIFWTAGSIFQLWMGEQISERGIGNGVSLMIFAGIILSLPYQAQAIFGGLQNGTVQWFSIVVMLLIFLVATWFIVYFTTAQRKIPIQHMRRQVGTKVIGGQTNYLPLTLNMAGVIPIIFAISLIFLPSQFAGMLGGPSTPAGAWLENLGSYLNPSSAAPLSKELWFLPKGLIGCVIYTALIFFFNYFYTALQYNVGDIADNMKKQGSFIVGVRPGKQTRDFLDGVIGRITFVGASFTAVVALLQYIAPTIARIDAGYGSVIGGTSLLIMVSVALETMRQIEANVLMRQYNQ